MTNRPSEIASRYRKVADAFTARAREVSAEGWDAPAPCEGWVARDIVRHMATWMPGYFLGSVGVAVPDLPSVDDDPLGAWLAVDGALQAAIDDPVIAAKPVDMQGEQVPFAEALSAFGIGDVLVHTWDLARATGQDETLDLDEVRRLMESSAPMDEVMRGEHFGPKVEVPDDADEQTKLIAFTGRTP